MPPLFF